jgi:hypothetical protein
MAREAARLLRPYGVTVVTIDRFAPGLVADLLRRENVTARVAAHDTSTAFVDLLAAVNADRVRLLDDPILLRELARLERRPGASGRDHVGHPPRGHDDVAAAAAFALGAALRAQSAPEHGLLFQTGPTALDEMKARVSDLVSTAKGAVGAVRSAMARGAVQWRRTQRTPEEQAERQAEAGRLRRLRLIRRQRAEAAMLAELARERVAREDAEYVAWQRAQAEATVLEAVARQGYWWPRE